MEAKRYLVSGRVQGVFFRASTQSRAKDLGLSGRVRNTPNGDVELLIAGAQEAVTSMCDWLRQGPLLTEGSEPRASNRAARSPREGQVVLTLRSDSFFVLTRELPIPVRREVGANQASGQSSGCTRRPL